MVARCGCHDAHDTHHGVGGAGFRFACDGWAFAFRPTTPATKKARSAEKMGRTKDEARRHCYWCLISTHVGGAVPGVVYSFFSGPNTEKEFTPRYIKQTTHARSGPLR
jgi:hypothetical protein